MTVQELINSSLRLIGVLAAGETPSTDESNDALAALNAMIEAWDTQHVAVYTIRDETFPLIAAQQSYTIGSGGNFDTDRPVKIEAANIITSGLTIPVKIINSIQWAAITEKGLSGTLPLQLYNDNAYPLATLKLWPKPSGTPSLQLFMWQKIAGTLALLDNIALPPGYLKAVRYNLALDLAPEFGRPVDPIVAQTAQAAKAALGGLNASNFAATEDPPAPVAAPPGAAA